MKRVKLLIAMTFAVVGSAMAQGTSINYNDPRYASWGPDAATREKNMFTATYMREALEAKEYDNASKHFQVLMANCPSASEAVFARAVQLYRAKVSGAKTLPEKRKMIDSLMIVHDLRLKYFSTHATRGKVFIHDSKAKDFFSLNKGDREGLREVFQAAIAAGGANPELIYLYFQNLCEDFKMDEVMADEVIAEYGRLSPMFENLPANQADLRTKFDSTFGASGVANCENLENIYKTKLAAEPKNEALFSQAVNLMDRAGCKTPFYTATVEKLYALSPTARAAMALAAIFQNDKQYDKASKYLRDALAVEKDAEEQEALNARIALVELAAGRNSAALAAARASIATPDGTTADNGIALFVIAQIYATSAANCQGFDRNIAYLAAYDAAQRAISNLSADEQDYKAPAQNLAATCRQYFPTTEECFFNEVKAGAQQRVNCGAAAGTTTTIRTR